MKKLNSSKFVILTIALIILASPLLTYLLCLLIKTTGLYKIVPTIGSVDTWISFAGSIIGGSITMLALYFTIRHDNNIKKQDEIIQIRPCLIGDLIYQSKEEKVILVSTIVDNMVYYLRWELLNVTNNTAKTSN
jgi:Phosphotransferase system, mannitol-specific IIBC component